MPDDRIVVWSAALYRAGLCPGLSAYGITAAELQRSSRCPQGDGKEPAIPEGGYPATAQCAGDQQHVRERTRRLHALPRMAQ